MNVPFPMRSVGVLHVDDDADAREIIGVAVGSDTIFNVRSCASGEEALAATAKWSPDLILLDLNMPGMDGPTTLARLREQPQTTGVPVIYVTAAARAREIGDLGDNGVAGIIAKPFDPTTLCSQINAILCRSHRKLAASNRELERRAAIGAGVMESSQDAIIAKDLGGTILSWNGAAERLLGFTADEVVGRNIRSFIPTDQLAEEDYLLSEVTRGRPLDYFETRGLRKGGTPIEVSLRVCPTRDRAGKIIGYSVIERDISQQRRTEAALGASEQRLTLAIQGMSVGVWDWNIADDTLYWSDRFKEMLGLPSDFVSAYNDFESRLHPDDRDRTTAAAFAHVERKEPYDVEYRLRKADGDYVWIHAMGQAAWDSAGKPLRMVGSVDDITSRKRAEERFRQVVESAPIAMVMVDKSGHIVLVNRRTEKLFGYAGNEMLGQKIELLMPTAHRNQHQGHINRYFVSPAVLDPSERAMGAGRELYGLRKDGSEFPVEIGLTPIHTDDGIMVLGAVVDLSERKRAEERFRQVVEFAPTAMVMMDRSGRIALVNRQTEQLFGYTSSELLGQKIERLMPATERGQHKGHIDRYFFSPAVLDPSERAMGAGRKLHGLRKDGSEFPVEIGLTPIRTDEGIMVLGAVVDITVRQLVDKERREFNERLEQQVAQRTAQLETANKELDDFAFAASHDLKAPLRVIDNASKWLEEDLAPYLKDETLENMRLLRGRVARLEKLLDDLLQFSRAGRDASNGEIMSGKELIDDVLAMLPLAAGFEVKVEPAFAAIRVARLPLQQILMNLISNAIKHHDKTTGCIEVTAADLGSHHAFAVKDDGPGIPAQFHNKIFKMFQTLKPRDQVEGSGMGLAIVRKQIELSGGSLSLESSEGNGSTFHFTLPAPQCAQEPQ
jgi:PAS domain S-box-containing protein